MHSVRVHKYTRGELAISWIFALLYYVIGILNLFLVHPVPAIFYVVFATLYLPQANVLLKQKTGFAVPLYTKVIVALVLLWGTLAVGDLAEVLGL